MTSQSSGRGRLVKQRMFGVRGVRKQTTVNNSAIATVGSDYFFGQRQGVISPNYPLIGTSVAFNLDPFNQFPYGGTAVGTFIDITSDVQAVDSSMGRQYELDTITSAEATLTLLDRAENYNPTNPYSTYYPNVKVYRQIFDGAMWPPVATAPNYNLMNTTYGADPTFESYAIGSIPGFVTQYTSTPAITTAQAFAGTQSLTMPISAGSSQQYLSWTVPCIPGQTYTDTVYVYTSAAFGVYISLFNAYGSGSSMNVGTTWTRLQITYQATQPLQMIVLYTFGTVPNGAIYADNIQHETGGVAHAFSTSGPVVYGMFGGFVERWPSNWNYQGTYGMAAITAVDGLTPMALWRIGPQYYDAIYFKRPSYYWQLNDSSDSTSFAETSGNNGPPLIVNNSKYGAGTVGGGQSINIVGYPGAQGILTTSTPSGTTFQDAGSALQAGLYGNGALSLGGDGTSTWTISSNFYTTFAPMIPTNTTNRHDMISFCGMHGVTGGPSISLYCGQFLSGGPLKFSIASYYNGVESLITVGSDHAADNSVHHMIFDAQFVSGTLQFWLYIDNVLDINFTINTNSTWGTTTPNFNITAIQVGGAYDPTGSIAGWNGIISQLAVWRRALSFGEVTDIVQAGNTGFSGDTTDVRILRYVDIKRFSGVNFETGATVLGPDSLGNDVFMADAIQAVATSENGNFFVDGFGTLTFHARTHRYLETSSIATFGENFAGGEIPYTADVAFDFDPTQVYNQVTVSQTNGITAQSANTSSQNRYGFRSVSLTTNAKSSLEAIDYANWIAAGHADPFQRVVAVTITPSSNPALWPYALGLKFGDRVTVTRRTPVFTMSSDYFIERIERSRDEQMNFTVTFQLSPATLTRQPWLLENATYGILDQTTILGF